MRKLTVFNLMTLDGYIAGQGGDISWHTVKVFSCFRRSTSTLKSGPACTLSTAATPLYKKIPDGRFCPPGKVSCLDRFPEYSFRELMSAR